MRRLAFVNPVRLQRKQAGVFMGLDTRDVSAENSFTDMKNMCADYYPAISTRRSRGPVIQTLAKPHGLFWKNGLAYVDGDSFYFDGQKIGMVQDNDKQMVGMGAYIIIFPDKYCFNTHDKSWKAMEASWQQSSSATIAPTYEGSTYVKITCTGIGKDFAQYDTVEISGCTNADLNKSVTIQQIQENEIIILGTLEEEFTQASGLKIERKIPDMDYITECDNRLWGCSNEKHEIYASKLGDPMNFSSFEGISSDSYAATVGSDGDFTGAVTHMGYVIFWKEDCYHKVMGNKPSNIQVNMQPARGVAKGCEKSLCIVNETLYYAGRNNICAFEGAMPRSISDTLQGLHYTEAAGKQYGNRYYLSVKVDEEWKLYVYDQTAGAWYLEDNTDLTYAAYGAGTLYYVDADGNIRTITGDSDEQIEWYMESGDQIEGSLEKKYLNKIQFMLELDAGAVVDIFLKYDAEEQWERILTVSTETKRSYSVPIRPKRCLRYRYRIQGIGGVKLYGIGKYIESGSEI